MNLVEQEQLKIEIQHIFDSGANEIRIFDMVRSFIETHNATSGLPIQSVSNPLNDLKNLLAKMTIELITTKKGSNERQLLLMHIEDAKESLKALK